MGALGHRIGDVIVNIRFGDIGHEGTDMRRLRNVKIVATLGPASETREVIAALHNAGADVFRLNMSHGSHEEIREKHRIIREIEKETGGAIGILADLQGPKLRVGLIEQPVIGMQTTWARKTARPIGIGARFCLLPRTIVSPSVVTALMLTAVSRTT